MNCEKNDCKIKLDKKERHIAYGIFCCGLSVGLVIGILVGVLL